MQSKSRTKLRCDGACELFCKIYTLFCKILCWNSYVMIDERISWSRTCVCLQWINKRSSLEKPNARRAATWPWEFRSNRCGSGVYKFASLSRVLAQSYYLQIMLKTFPYQQKALSAHLSLRSRPAIHRLWSFDAAKRLQYLQGAAL